MAGSEQGSTDSGKGPKPAHVAGQMKDILTTGLGLFLFGDVKFDARNVTGVCIGLLGGIAYSLSSYYDRQKPAQKPVRGLCHGYADDMHVQVINGVGSFFWRHKVGRPQCHGSIRQVPWRHAYTLSGSCSSQKSAQNVVRSPWPRVRKSCLFQQMAWYAQKYSA